ncbi:MAG: hypothetical protein QM757_41465 [Paludibaculum sp.]
MRNIVKCLFILAILSAANLSAQFASLSTTNDGSVLYFTTPLTRTGTEQPSHGKTFRIGANGLEVVEIRTVTPTAEGSRISNYYDIQRVTVSGDGRTVATAARRDCNAMGCEHISNTSTTAVGNGSAVEFTGPATMSTNGRYLVNYATPAPDRSGTLSFSSNCGRRVLNSARLQAQRTARRDGSRPGLSRTTAWWPD